LLAVLPFAIATKLICFGIWSSGWEIMPLLAWMIYISTQQD
jgi:hypothetical protein